MVKDYLFKKPNQKQTSQVSPHQYKKYDDKRKLFEPSQIKSVNKNTLSVVFPVACVLAQTFIFDLFEVTYNNIRLQGDIASYQLYKNGSAVTLPVKLTDTDELTIEITKNDFLNAGSVELYT